MHFKTRENGEETDIKRVERATAGRQMLDAFVDTAVLMTYSQQISWRRPTIVYVQTVSAQSDLILQQDVSYRLTRENWVCAHVLLCHALAGLISPHYWSQ